MRNMFLINGTDYIWATSGKRAKEVYEQDVLEEVKTVEPLPADKPVYIQEPPSGGEGLWWFKLHDGWKLIRQTTVSEYFSVYCGDSDVIAYSTDW
ncbi:hypothetical protein ABE237_00685 [Brevibacillus formosus]|uniref:hypothetical protein n=1 Tax=Brevibacillus formosus TaxID=54913 RepID=UPI0018CE3B12|nr:hypothetical protein [Brevibacillus formosus]MBG9944666.1 hypothetical protein [Brevibacillus formosus]